MTGTYFNAPDCIEAIQDEPIPRDRLELEAAARSVGETEILILTEREFAAIKAEVGLGYRWRGHRIFVR